jgi:hypothetical protein
MYNHLSFPTITNVIIANSPSGGNCSGDYFNTSSANNLIDDTSCGNLFDGVNGNKVGASYSANLGPLGNNGGPTQTMALLPGSTAIDAGDNAAAIAAGLTTDQRGAGFPRKNFGTVDIGAFELQQQCPAGKYDDGTGCVDASPGYFVHDAGATSQTPCPVGTFQPASGATSCDPAPAGSYVSTTGAASATLCPVGTYQDQTGATSCNLADPGYYVDTTGAASQTMCPVGYTSEAGATECTPEIVNTAPTAAAGGPYLGAVNTSIAFDGSASSDPESDPLTYAWDFGDSSSGSGVMPGHDYSEAGIYTVCLTVNDGDLSSEANCTMAVVYDPSAGFVTGGGWIDSPVNAEYQYMQTGGKATFGFVAKYKKGANVPDGNTEFQFKAGDLNFKSVSYEWLVVAGNMAQFKGEGTINGQGVYQFMITADDDNPDTFRIKIWDD